MFGLPFFFNHKIPPYIKIQNNYPINFKIIVLTFCDMFFCHTKNIKNILKSVVKILIIDIIRKEKKQHTKREDFSC